jgi:formate dehydrogenase major subunit
MRSHDQYNTTLYSLSDRYRGVFGQRMVVFINQAEMDRRGLIAGEHVTLETLSTDGAHRAVEGFKVVPYLLPDGCCGAYYPEANPLVPLYARDPQSGTPSYKSVPIRIRGMAQGG